MALQKTVTINDVEIQNAYIRVAEFSGNKTDVAFVVSYHANANASAFHRKGFASISYDLSNGNFIAQAYEHLKTLPEFAGATDV